MAKFLFLLVFGLGAFVLHVNTLQHGAIPEFLHSNYEHNRGVRRPQIITRERELDYSDEPKVSSHLHRHRRDTVPIGKINEDPGPDIKPRVSILSFLFHITLILIKAIKKRLCRAGDWTGLSHKGILSLWLHPPPKWDVCANDLLLKAKNMMIRLGLFHVLFLCGLFLFSACESERTVGIWLCFRMFIQRVNSWKEHCFVEDFILIYGKGMVCGFVKELTLWG